MARSNNETLTNLGVSLADVVHHTLDGLGGYVAGTLNYRHWKTAATPVELIELFFPKGWDD
jgi:hypothetical protein